MTKSPDEITEILTEEGITRYHGQSTMQKIAEGYSYLQVRYALADCFYEVVRDGKIITLRDIMYWKLLCGAFMLTHGHKKSCQVIVDELLQMLTSLGGDVKHMDKQIHQLTLEDMERAKQLLKRLEVDTKNMRKVGGTLPLVKL